MLFQIVTSKLEIDEIYTEEGLTTFEDEDVLSLTGSVYMGLLETAHKLPP